MKYPQQLLFSEDRIADEIDELFSQLQVITPPESLVDSILDSVSRLSYTRTITPMLWENIDGLVVRHDHLEPS